MQAYQWAAQYPAHGRGDPSLLRRRALLSPSTTPFSTARRQRLQADAAWNGGNYSSAPETGLRAFGRVYVAWAYSHAFFVDRLYRQLGFATLEDFVRDWEEDHLKWDANDLLAKIGRGSMAISATTYLCAATSATPCRSIEARAIVMPCSSDMYFVPSDNEAEVASHAARRAPRIHVAMGPLRSITRPPA